MRDYPLVAKALRDRYLHLDENRDEVTYLPQGKVRKLSNPEEQVQLLTYVSLIYEYDYPPEKLRVSDKVKMGSSTREADIMVYSDMDAKDPLIVVECKKQHISDEVFTEAIDQGFSYAAPTDAEYVWATSYDRNAYFEMVPGALYERDLNKIADIPRHNKKHRKLPRIFRQLKFIGKHPATSDSLMYLLVLVSGVALLSVAAVWKNENLMADTHRLWAERGMNYSWLFHAINLAAIGFSLLWGLLFMRSHEFFEIPKSRRSITYLLLATVLYVPVWYLTSHFFHPEWWSEAAFAQRKIKSLTYLWPYTVVLPVQAIAIFFLVWVLSLSDRRKTVKARNK